MEKQRRFEGGLEAKDGGDFDDMVVERWPLEKEDGGGHDEIKWEGQGPIGRRMKCGSKGAAKEWHDGKKRC